MIIADKEASLEKANEISAKLLSFITEEIKAFNCDDDPAEQIYLGCHIIASLLARLTISLKNFGDIYSILNLTTDSIIQWIITITNEHIKINADMMK